jgi:hypothetical protein
LTERDKVANADKSDGANSVGNTGPIKKKRGTPENLKPRWKPGQSGNPSGRRPMPPEIIEALELGSLNAAKRLVTLTQDPDGRVALTAIDMLQNRLYGRAQQQADVNVTTTNVQQAHLQVLVELQQRRDQAMKTIEADEGGTQRVEEYGPLIAGDITYTKDNS